MGDVTALDFNLRYDPTSLQVSGHLRGAGLPGDASLMVDLSTLGVAHVTITRVTPLPAGTIELVRLVATVPDTSVYGAKNFLNIDDLTANGGALVVLDDDSIHVVAYLGDATGCLAQLDGRDADAAGRGRAHGRL